jgi:hypothetical protein
MATGENIKSLKAALPWVNGHNDAPQHLHLLQRSICAISRLQVVPPRCLFENSSSLKFSITGGASQHRLFFLQSIKGLTFNLPRRLYIAVRHSCVQPLGYLESGVEPVSTLWIKPSFFVATHITASLEPLGNVMIA